MKNSGILLSIMMCTACVWLLGGCASGKSSGKQVQVTPETHVLTPDANRNLCMDVTFHVPSHYFSKRSRLIIVPQLLVNEKVSEELTPLVVDAPIYEKKLWRKKVAQNYQDPYEAYKKKTDNVFAGFELPYQETFTMPCGAHTGRIRAIVTEDGCGDCTGLDTIDVASIRDWATLIQDTLALVWMEPKIYEGKGEALLQFIINRHEIRLDLGNNRSQLEGLTNVLRSVLADTLAVIKDFRIYGMASADGPYDFNTALARRRAESAKKWLQEELSIRPELYARISVDSRPEGWQSVYHAMVADGHPDSLSVKQILMRYTEGNDDVQEYYIRRLPCWKDIRDRYLQKDRKVECVYFYTLNEPMRATDGTLIPSPQAQMEANNQAILCLRGGQFEKSLDLLKEFTHYVPAAMNTLAVSHFRTEDTKQAETLLRQVELPEARYNLGVLMALKGNWQEAYRLLKGSGSVNEAVVALSLDYNKEAKSVMDKLADKTPLAEYVRALVAARLKDDAAFWTHLRNACQNNGLRLRAAGEPDFGKYRNETAFREIIK